MTHIQHLAERLRHNAEFRREKQNEHPEDDRNADGAQDSERLAAEFEAGRYSEALARTYGAFCEDSRTVHSTVAAESEFVAGIGFGRHFDDADALLGAIIERARGPHDDGVDFVDDEGVE